MLIYKSKIILQKIKLRLDSLIPNASEEEDLLENIENKEKNKLLQLIIVPMKMMIIKGLV